MWSCRNGDILPHHQKLWNLPEWIHLMIKISKSWNHIIFQKLFPLLGVQACYEIAVHQNPYRFRFLHFFISVRKKWVQVCYLGGGVSLEHFRSNVHLEKNELSLVLEQSRGKTFLRNYFPIRFFCLLYFLISFCIFPQQTFIISWCFRFHHLLILYLLTPYLCIYLWYQFSHLL